MISPRFEDETVEKMCNPSETQKTDSHKNSGIYVVFRQMSLFATIVT